jgi:hypothetical protein
MVGNGGGVGIALTACGAARQAAHSMSISRMRRVIMQVV